MFCPQCKTEYREGITHCPECDVDLISSLFREARGDFSLDDGGQSAVVVWQGTDPLLADWILDLLETRGVEAYSDRLLTNEMPIPFGRDSYGIWVRRKDQARTRKLIRALLEGVEEESEERAPFAGLEDAT